MQPEEHPHTTELKSLRTYQGDVEETIHSQKESIVSITAKEQIQRTTEPRPYIEDSESSHFFSFSNILIAICIICIFIGAGSLWFVFNTPDVDDLAVQRKNAILSYTKKEVVTVTDDIRNSIVSDLKIQTESTPLEFNAIGYWEYVQNGKILSGEIFINTLATNAKSTLGVSVDGQNYMSGIYSLHTNQFFFIARIKDFAAAYRAMIEWEPFMIQDLSFALPQNTNEQSYGAFEDDIIRNKDVRMLRNQDKDIVLMYSFIDNQTLAITTNDKVFNGLLTKYINSKLTQ